MHEPVTVQAFGSEALKEILFRHPFVEVDLFAEDDEPRIEFRRGGWERRVVQAKPSVLYGLPELMDNNPLVCADEASCPGAAATLAAIAAGPLARAGLLAEAPAMLFSFEGDYDEVDAVLAAEGWNGGATCAGDPLDMRGCLACACLANIKLPDDPSELDALYAECFGRSFFVWEHTEGDWAPALVRGKPSAYYQLVLSEGEGGNAVLRADVLADIDGKCGAAQLVHTMNIMACFEEDLGLSVVPTAGTVGAG